MGDKTNKRERAEFETKIDNWLETQASVKLANKPEIKQKFMNCYDSFSMSKLDLSGYGLTSLPDCFNRFTSLFELKLSKNKLKELPSTFSKLWALHVLDLSSNEFQSLPENIGDRYQLRKLFVDNNQLESIPDSITKLINLEELNIINNRIGKLPNNIFALKRRCTITMNEGNCFSETYLQGLRSRCEDYLQPDHPRLILPQIDGSAT